MKSTTCHLKMILITHLFLTFLWLIASYPFFIPFELFAFMQNIFYSSFQGTFLEYFWLMFPCIHSGVINELIHCSEIHLPFHSVIHFSPTTWSPTNYDLLACFFFLFLTNHYRNTYQFKGPWVECTGNEVIDVENAGEIKIAPSREWPRYMFPYRGHADYMSPFIALKLQKPATGVAISMTCRLWARNIVYNATASGLNDTMIDDEIVPSAILPFNIFIE